MSSISEPRQSKLTWICGSLLLLQCLLPAEARLHKANTQPVSPTTILQPHLQLHGEVSIDTTPDPIKQRVDQLVQTAMSKSEAANKLVDSEKHFKSKFQKVVQRSKDALNYVVQYRGLSMSSEAGDVITNEKSKLKSAFSSEYFRQKHMDELQARIVASILEIASGLGMADQEIGRQDVSAGVKILTELVGPEDAQNTVEAISTYVKENPIPDSAFQQRPWSITQKQTKQKLIMEQCLLTDPVIQEIKKRVYKYNHRSQLSLGTARVVQTTLGICSFTPTLAAPAAGILQFAYDMATGGAEEDKLIRELYLDQRLDSRSLLLNETASMGLHGYQMGLLTGNKALMSVSKSIVGQLSGPDGSAQIFSNEIAAKPAAPATNAAPAPKQAAAAAANNKPL